MPLSKVIVDGTLNMGDYPLVGQMIMAPYRPYTWETETFQYKDRGARTVVEETTHLQLDGEALITTWTCDSPNPCYVYAKATSLGGGFHPLSGPRITVNGETVYTSGQWPAGTTKTTDTVIVCPGEVVELYITGPGFLKYYALVDTGYEAPINLNLEGRFLALDQDFGELTATLTFGDEANVAFSDYINRFPYAPDKITFNRHTLEKRPVINVYKGV